MILSKITAKAQTTIPRPVREALGIAPGDQVAYVIRDGEVVLSRVDTDEDMLDNPFATFTEWADELDCAAFDNL